jgi:hypothetical protein
MKSQIGFYMGYLEGKDRSHQCILQTQQSLQVKHNNSNMAIWAGGVAQAVRAPA